MQGFSGVLKLLVVAVATVGLTACMDENSGPAPDALGRDPSPMDYVKLEKGPCFGSCPNYEITLYGDGRVVFYGRRFTREDGEVIDYYSTSRFLEVLDALDARGFDDLQDNYDSKTCTALASDHPTLTITLRDGDTLKRVRWNTGCRGFDDRDRLEKLERDLDWMLDVDRFVGTDAERKPAKR